jgi:predicted RNase H-like HicB family nuclease
MTDTKRRRYLATYTHDDQAWIVQFREPDIATFGRTLAAAKKHARSALAVHLEVADLEAAGVEIVDDVRIPDPVAAEVDWLIDQRSTVDALRSELARSTRAAAADLRRLGFSTRDVGEILGISGSRVAQMDRESGTG